MKIFENSVCDRIMFDYNDREFIIMKDKGTFIIIERMYVFMFWNQFK